MEDRKEEKLGVQMGDCLALGEARGEEERGGGEGKGSYFSTTKNRFSLY